MNYNRLQKAKKIARETFRNYNGVYPEHVDRPQVYQGGLDAHLGLYRKTRKICSGPCCGNPRKHFGEKTRQERKSDDDFKQYLEEI
ncbi:MAG: hypothetical protein RBR97_17465 [Bacteroidales bacterium]|nr:hypothetical protein [Bacteroidales bacterium]